MLKKITEMLNGKKKAEEEYKKMSYGKMSNFGSVKKLTILPLVDFYADREDLKTEPGVSYLIKADDTTILMDLGFNKKKEHPSPLLQNMRKLGIESKDVDAIFISHSHLDHVGGMKEYKQKTFSLSKGRTELRKIPVYAPNDLSPSDLNPGPEVEVIKGPKILRKGIASTGVIPRFLFLQGYTEEHSLAINVEGKGMVQIVGCGHQTIERIIERSKMLFDEPIYGIVGGLHFPVNGGRIMLGPLNLQNIVGYDELPWRGNIGEEHVRNAIEAIKKEDPQLVSLSPHDSSDWSLDQFKRAFGDKYHELKAGKEITI